MSDVSSEDGFVSSTTSVLLGYASRGSTGDDISFLGGQPLWLGDVKPSYDLFQCRVCSGTMSQLLQLNAELPEHFPTHDRRLHVMVCRRKACARKPGSIRVVRATRQSTAVTATRVQQQQQQQQQQQSSSSLSSSLAPTSNLGNAIFGAGPVSPFGANPFTKSPFPTENPVKESAPPEPPDTLYSTAVQKSHSPQVSKTSVPWPQDVSSKIDFPKLYLDAEYETLDEVKFAEQSSAHQLSGSLDESGDMSTDNSDAKEDAEVFESDLDKTFRKFADRLAQNPEQVIRYEFKGTPLLYSAADDVGKIFSPDPSARESIGKRTIPPCNICNKLRVFEVQLTPHAIIELEEDDLSLDGMEWGTIIVGVCSADCQARDVGSDDVGYIEEWIGIQWEERKK